MFTVAVFATALLVEPTGALLVPAAHTSPTELLLSSTMTREAGLQKRRYYHHGENRIIYTTRTIEQCSMTTQPLFSCSTTIIRNEVQGWRRGRAATTMVVARYRLPQSTPAMLLSRVGVRRTSRQGSRVDSLSGEEGGSGGEDSETGNIGANDREDEEPIDNSAATTTSSSADKEIDEGFDVDGGPPTMPFSFTQAERLSDVATSGTTSNTEDNDSSYSSWWPRLFPLASEDGDDEPDGALIELPLDGVLLQLFPALLIAVVGLVMTVAVQLEASRFDGMVGEDGGAVVVTDLRAPRSCTHHGV